MPDIIFKVSFNIILTFMPESSSAIFSLGFPSKVLYMWDSNSSVVLGSLDW